MPSAAAGCSSNGCWPSKAAPFSLVAALNNAVTLVRERATSHGIRLELDVAIYVGVNAVAWVVGAFLPLDIFEEEEE